MFHPPRKKLPAFGVRQIRRVIIFIVGMTVLSIGIALIVLPGPAMLVIPSGLAILGIEFQWARRWLRKARAMLDKTGNPDHSKSSSQPPVRRFDIGSPS